ATNSAACGGVVGSVSYSDESLRRFVSFTTAGGGTGGTTTNTAWDSSGRATAGTMAGGATFTNVYDNSARTLRSTVSGGTTTVSTTTFDANGTNISTVVTSGLNTSTSTNTITATDKVCK